MGEGEEVEEENNAKEEDGRSLTESESRKEGVEGTRLEDEEEEGPTAPSSAEEETDAVAPNEQSSSIASSSSSSSSPSSLAIDDGGGASAATWVETMKSTHSYHGLKLHFHENGN